MQPEDGAIRMVSEPIVACVCVVINFQEQIRGFWEVDILLQGQIEAIQLLRRSVTMLSETAASVTKERPVSVRLLCLPGKALCP